MTKAGYLRNEHVIKKFGNHLRKLRRGKGLSQVELALKADITITYISKLEHGKVNTSLSHMAAIATALDIKIIDLLNFPD